MLIPYQQNWRTTALPYSLALARTVNTGGSFTTPSGATANSAIWAKAGFRGFAGFGPTMTFPGGSGMDAHPAVAAIHRRLGRVDQQRNE